MIFLNYRKIDSTPETRSLKVIFDQVFGVDSTFLDNYTIYSGEEWPEKIKFELFNSQILIVVIGPDWLKVNDSFGNKLLDNTNDWVRIEIEKALYNKIDIIPILVAGAKIPLAEDLPNSIKEICNYQFYELRDSHWKIDIIPIINRIEKFVASEISLSNVIFPEHCDHIPRFLTPTEFSNKLSELTSWRLQTLEVPNKKNELGNELVRKYEFVNFLDTIKFMSEAAKYIDKVNHHPKWENIWKNLFVHLTTHDIGHKISALDFDLAFYLEYLYNTSFKSYEI